MAVVAYWPLDDAAGSRRAVSAVGGTPLLARVNVGAGITPAAEFTPFAWQRGELHQWLPPCLQAESGGDLQGGKLVDGRVTRTGVAGEWALDFLYRATAQPGADDEVAVNSHYFLRQTDGIEWILDFHPGNVVGPANGTASVTAFDSDGNLLGGNGSIATNNLHDGAIKHIRLSVLDGGGGQGNWLLRVDGTIVGSGIVNLGTALQAPDRFEMFWDGESIQSPPRVLPFHVGQVVVWDNPPLSVLDTGDIILGHQGETPMERIRRLCLEDGVPFTGFGNPAIHEHATVLGPQQTDTFVGLLRDAERSSAGGVLYELTGGLAYATVEQRYNQVPTLAFDIATEPRLSEAPEPIDDDQQLVNQVTVTRPLTGEARRREDATSIAESGIQPIEVQINCAGEVQLEDIAEWLLHVGLGARDEYRWPVLTMDLARNPELIPAWLDFRIGGRVNVSGMFSGQLPGHLVDVLGEGWSETVRSLGGGRVQWQVALNAVPAKPFTVGVYAAAGTTPAPDAPQRYSSDGTFRTIGAISPTATAIAFTITQGPFWTTDPAALPFDIAVGGERMRVTAIAAPQLPGNFQTFTVVRSINGVVKEHPNGVEVQLWTPARYAL